MRSVGGNLHVDWRGVPGAAVSVGVQVVQRAVEVLVGRLHQGRGAAAQRARRAATQQSRWTPAQQSGRATAH